MSSNIGSRFQVCDACCGFVAAFGDSTSAVKAARAHWQGHLDDRLEFVTVLDTMARASATNVRRVDRHGHVRHVRIEKGAVK